MVDNLSDAVFLVMSSRNMVATKGIKTALEVRRRSQSKMYESLEIKVEEVAGHGESEYLVDTTSASTIGRAGKSFLVAGKEGVVGGELAPESAGMDADARDRLLAAKKKQRGDDKYKDEGKAAAAAAEDKEESEDSDSDSDSSSSSSDDDDDDDDDDGEIEDDETADAMTRAEKRKLRKKRQSEDDGKEETRTGERKKKRKRHDGDAKASKGKRLIPEFDIQTPMTATVAVRRRYRKIKASPDLHVSICILILGVGVWVSERIS